MPEVSEQTNTRQFPAPKAAESYTSTIYDGVYYAEQRDDDMGETSIHIKLLANFLNILAVYFENRTDVFFSGNMNLYFERGNSRRWYAPDLLVAFGVPNVERSSYLLWREEIFPQVLFEIASEKTWSNDIDEKLRVYEEYGAEEYYVLDPEFAYLPAPLMAFRRQGEKLVESEVKDDRVFSPRLNLEIVWNDRTFRFYNPRTKDFLLTLNETERQKREYKSRAELAENELEKLKAEIERLKSQK